MNKQRRKALGVLRDRLIALKLDDTLDELNDISNELSDLADEEEAVAGRMVNPDKKAEAEDAAMNLAAACDYVSDLIQTIEAENPVSLIDEARGVE